MKKYHVQAPAGISVLDVSRVLLASVGSLQTVISNLQLHLAAAPVHPADTVCSCTKGRPEAVAAECQAGREPPHQRQPLGGPLGGLQGEHSRQIDQHLQILLRTDAIADAGLLAMIQSGVRLLQFSLWHPRRLRWHNTAVLHAAYINPKPACAQLAIDIATPPEVFEAVKLDLEAFFAENASEYSGKFLCVANFAGDPLKFTL